MLNALCAAIPARERVSVGEVFDVQVACPTSRRMQDRRANLEGTGRIPLRRLLKRRCGAPAAADVR